MTGNTAQETRIGENNFPLRLGMIQATAMGLIIGGPIGAVIGGFYMGNFHGGELNFNDLDLDNESSSEEEE